jgi:hypothetical protein
MESVEESSIQQLRLLDNLQDSSEDLVDLMGDPTTDENNEIIADIDDIVSAAQNEI